MNYIEAIKAKYEGKQIRYNGNCYDETNCEMILGGVEELIPFLKTSEGVKPIPIGCIKGDWQIYEEECKNCGVLMNFKNHTCKCNEEKEWNLFDEITKWFGYMKIHPNCNSADKLWHILRLNNQKVKEDIKEQLKSDNLRDDFGITLIIIDEIMDKRAGRL